MLKKNGTENDRKYAVMQRLTFFRANMTLLVMFKLRVNALQFYTPDIFEIALERQGYDFVPGQCAVLFDDTGDSRPYSISSGTDEAELRFLLRRFTGGRLSNWLADRQPGDRGGGSLPFGEFRPAEPKNKPVFIATGVGISPFLSALRSPKFDAEQACCLYGVRRLEDAVPLPSIGNVHVAISREKVEGHLYGRVTDLLKTISLPDAADYYICGCDAMTDEVYDLLRARKVPASRIHTEVFFSSK
jgi:ferredoxin-NADP reductase